MRTHPSPPLPSPPLPSPPLPSPPPALPGMQHLLEVQELQAAKNKEQEEAFRVKKRTYDLLPNADENIVKLQVCPRFVHIQHSTNHY